MTWEKSATRKNAMAPKKTAIKANSKRDQNVRHQEFTVKTLKKALLSAGHIVESTTSSAEAEEQILAFRPDYVLIDILMPEVNGLELCQRLRRHSELDKAQLLIVTGTMQQDTAIEAKKAGADGFVTKPIERDQLLEQMEHMASLRESKS